MGYAEDLAKAADTIYLAREDNAPTVISTFAGGGGSSLGYHMAGYRELMAIEWDAHACRCLRKNFPHVEVIEGDIGEVSVDEILKKTGLKKGELDVFDGSPPCQGFSTAGKRRVVDDRNSLFKHYVRLIDGLAPKVFVMENVPGMVRGDMRVVFAKALNDLRGAGYEVKSWVLNAKHYGVPQARQRLFFIGVRKDLNIVPTPPPTTHAQPKSLRNLGAPVVPKGLLPVVTMGTAIEIESDGFYADGQNAGTRISRQRPSPTILKSAIGGVFQSSFCVAVGGWQKGQAHYLHNPSPTITKSGISKARNSDYAIITGGFTLGRKIPLAKPSPTVMKNGMGGVHNGQVSLINQAAPPPNTSNTYCPANTLPAPPVPNAADKVKRIFGPKVDLAIRRLSVGEVMRLQSFPDTYEWPEKTRWAAGWARVGNSVPPLLMRAISSHIRKTILKK